MTESNTAKAILEEPTVYSIQGVAIKAAPPSTATLIKVSGLVSQIPQIRSGVEEVVLETLRVAKDCNVIGEIAACLLVGHKGKAFIKRKLFGLIPYKRRITSEKLANMILDEPPSFMAQIIMERLNSLEVADFFGITTSLAEVNILKPTKKAKEVV
jgi:hypothetical protein